jgi:HAD superfamily hydrolase (TIGR01662 family)
MEKVIIFDFDGTIMDTQIGILRCFGEVLENFDHSQQDESKVKKLIGKPLSEMFGNFCSESTKIEQMIDMYRQLYFQKGIQMSKLYPDIIETLQILKSKNYTLTIATSKGKNAVNQLLEINNLRQYFGLVVAEEDVKNKKPHPEAIQKTFTQYLNITRSKFVMVGDASVDIEMGKNAKIETAWVNWGYSKLEDLLATPDHIFEKTLDLCQL